MTDEARQDFQAATPQPPPTRGVRVVLDDLIELLRSRSEFGERKYGTKLETWNGRDAYLDALQEQLDQFVYLHQAQMQYAELEEQLRSMKVELARVRDERDAARHNYAHEREALDAEVRARATRIRRLYLKPGEVAVLELEDRLDMATIDRMKRDWSGALGGAKLIILDGGAKLAGLLSEALADAVERALASEDRPG